MDYLFPSSRAAVANGQAQGVSARSSDIILNSPIVIYTYKDVADALVGSGIMSKDGDTYKLDAAAAVDAMVADKSWADLGYANGYGQFRIDSTDPAKSNSGNEWAALVATVLNGGQPATADSVARDADKIRAIFQKSGWMETSSEDSFSQFLTLGEGSKPMMVGYESQVLDLAVEPARPLQAGQGQPGRSLHHAHRVEHARAGLARRQRRPPARLPQERRRAEAGVGAPRVSRGLPAGHGQREPLWRARHSRARPGGGGAAQQ